MIHLGKQPHTGYINVKKKSKKFHGRQHIINCQVRQIDSNLGRGESLEQARPVRGIRLRSVGTPCSAYQTQMEKAIQAKASVMAQTTFAGGEHPGCGGCVLSHHLSCPPIHSSSVLQTEDRILPFKDFKSH